jgi:hypothetical protein
VFDGAIDKLGDRITEVLNRLFSRFMDELVARKRVRIHIAVDAEDKTERHCLCGRKIEDE